MPLNAAAGLCKILLQFFNLTLVFPFTAINKLSYCTRCTLFHLLDSTCPSTNIFQLCWWFVPSPCFIDSPIQGLLIPLLIALYRGIHFTEVMLTFLPCIYPQGLLLFVQIFSNSPYTVLQIFLKPSLELIFCTLQPWSIWAAGSKRTQTTFISYV